MKICLYSFEPNKIWIKISEFLTFKVSLNKIKIQFKKVKSI